MSKTYYTPKDATKHKYLSDKQNTIAELVFIAMTFV